MRKPYHKVEHATIVGKTLRLRIDGELYSFDLSKISERLRRASEKEVGNFRISPSGYGIHWPLVDEDLSIDGLLRSSQRAQKRKAKAAV